MLTGILAATYGASAAGIIYMLTQVWRLDNEMVDYNNLRQTDFTYENIDKSSLPR